MNIEQDINILKQLIREYKRKPETQNEFFIGLIEERAIENILTVLQTIVDENARLEDIEDRKVQIEYNNVFNKGIKSVEDKIKAKIEEYEKMLEATKMDKTYYGERRRLVIEAFIAELQSLLEDVVKGDDNIE